MSRLGEWAAATILATIVLTSTAAATLDVDLAGYRRTPGRSTVAGRVWQERRRPRDADRPLSGTAVTIFPRSAALLDRLTALKTNARDSMNGYRQAAPAMRRLRDDYETALWNAGFPDLVRATVVDADGRFAFDDVPAGEWIVFAWNEAFVATNTPGVRRHDRKTFAIGPGIEGFGNVMIWVREVTVGTSNTGILDLTDRNAWFNGVAESEAPGAVR
jgi:hypothetical protein